MYVEPSPKPPPAVGSTPFGSWRSPRGSGRASRRKGWAALHCPQCPPARPRDGWAPCRRRPGHHVQATGPQLHAGHRRHLRPRRRGAGPGGGRADRQAGQRPGRERVTAGDSAYNEGRCCVTSWDQAAGLLVEGTEGTAGGHVCKWFASALQTGPQPGPLGRKNAGQHHKRS